MSEVPKPRELSSNDGKLLPCPFCGGDDARVDEKGMPPTMNGRSSLISVEINHWCPRGEGQLSRRNLCFAGRDHETAIAAWNTRTTVSIDRLLSDEAVEAAIDAHCGTFGYDPFLGIKDRVRAALAAAVERAK